MKLLRYSRKNKMVALGIVLLVIILFSIIVIPFFLEHPFEQSLLRSREAPGGDYVLGTDDLGRDVLSRLLYGGRVSLRVGLIAVSIYVILGTFLGVIAGYFGGKLENIIMRITDAVLCFPPIIVALTLIAVIGPSVRNVIIVIAALRWPQIVRIVRGETIRLREEEFISAAKALGQSDVIIMLKHILPNLTGALAVATSFGLAEAILMEAMLSFLGFGVRPPIPTWGNMLNAAQSLTVLQRMPWLWIPPGLMIFFTVLSINFVGDGIRDFFDPRT